MLTDKDAKYLFALIVIFWATAFLGNFVVAGPLWFTHAFVATLAAFFGTIVQAAKYFFNARYRKAHTMEKHFVQLMSPGSFVSEVSSRPIDSWDVETARDMAKTIKERHNSLPYGFRFITKSRGDDDLDSKVIKTSHMYYLGGKVFTLKEVIAKNDPSDRILISNMKGNNYDRVIENNNSWKITLPLKEDDVVLENF